MFFSSLSWALSADMQSSGTNAGSRAAQDESRQVKVYRLQRGDADSIVQRLSRVLDPNSVRLVAYRRTNVVIVSAPSGMQKAMEKIIALLDGPQGSSAMLSQNPMAGSYAARARMAMMPRMAKPAFPARCPLRLVILKSLRRLL